MKFGILMLAAGAIGLTGCATKPRCEFMDGREVCASMGEAYKGAMAGGGNKDNVLAPVESRDPKAPAAPLNLQVGRHQLAGPVFVPPKPYRFWVAPWSDANGVLHSGEQMFFTTPGKWAYGPMNKNGAAGDLISPITPGDLGFKPLVVTPEQQRQRQQGRGRQEQRRNGITLPDKEISSMSNVDDKYGEPVGGPKK